MRDLALRSEGIAKSFGDVRAVHQLDLAVERGQIVALLGPSGCGKTTTLRLIAGFEVPDAGIIEVGGRRVAGSGTWVPPEIRRVGMVFQDYALFPHLTVAQNIAYGLPRGLDRASRVREIMSLVGLTGFESRMPHQLSGGEQQRVALARALGPDPEVLLLDEPFSNLDAGLRGQVRADVRDILKKSGSTVIFVTHDQEEALFMGDVVAVMNYGHVEQVDTPENIFHAPTTRFVANFMGIAEFLSASFQGDTLMTEIGSVGRYPTLEPVDGLEVMVRPDDLTLHPSDIGQGRIVDKMFQGAFYLYRVALNSGIVVHCLEFHTENYAIGTQVEVRLNPGHRPLCFLNGHVFIEESQDKPSL
ncbi:MAG: ABC transporter ATP-binding protein [Dehalococcoidia bacterium]